MRHADRGLASLRIVVGVWFLTSLFTKLGVTLALGVVPVPVASSLPPRRKRRHRSSR